MGKTVVVYKSNYGSTKAYAEAIAKALDADLFYASQVGVDKLLSYNTIVYGGGLYASGINGVSLISKNFEKLKSKNLVVFTVGLAPPEDKAGYQSVINNNFTDDMQSKIAVFNFRGAIEYKKLKPVHRFMMAVFKAFILKKNSNDPAAAQMLKCYDEKIDFTDIDAAQPLIDYVKKL